MEEVLVGVEGEELVALCVVGMEEVLVGVEGEEEEGVGFGERTGSILGVEEVVARVKGMEVGAGMGVEEEGAELGAGVRIGTEEAACVGTVGVRMGVRVSSVGVAVEEAVQREEVLRKAGLVTQLLPVPS